MPASSGSSTSRSGSPARASTARSTACWLRRSGSKQAPTGNPSITIRPRRCADENHASMPGRDLRQAHLKNQRPLGLGQLVATAAEETPARFVRVSSQARPHCIFRQALSAAHRSRGPVCKTVQLRFSPSVYPCRRDVLRILRTAGHRAYPFQSRARVSCTRRGVLDRAHGLRQGPRRPQRDPGPAVHVRIMQPAERGECAIDGRCGRRRGTTGGCARVRRFITPIHRTQSKLHHRGAIERSRGVCVRSSRRRASPI
jgi:hypothetical protein